jgi:hypothetical protein
MSLLRPYFQLWKPFHSVVCAGKLLLCSTDAIAFTLPQQFIELFYASRA